MPRIKTPRVVNNVITAYYIAKALKADAEYELMIEASQEKIGQYKPVPYVPVVIA